MTSNTKNHFWSFLERFGQQGISLLIFMIMARILSPADYGMANICFIYLMLTNSLILSLMDGVIAQKIQLVEKLSSLFYFCLMIGILIAGICAMTAPLMADWMQAPTLTHMLYLFSVVPVLLALEAIPRILLLQQLKFKSFAIRSVFSSVFSGIIAIYMGLHGFNAYALIWQQIIMLICTNIIAWGSVSWKPCLYFNKQDILDILPAGQKLLLINGMNFIEQQSPRLLIGAVLGTQTVGHYAFITRLLFALQDILIMAPMNVFYPTLAHMDREHNAQALYAQKLNFVFMLLFYPCLTLLILCLPIFIPLFFGQQWQEAIMPLQFFLMILYVNPAYAIIRDMFRANQKLNIFTTLHMRVVLVKICLMGLLCFPNGFFYFSIMQAICAFIGLFFYHALLQKHFHISLFCEKWQIYTGIIFGLCTMVGVFNGMTYLNLYQDHWLHQILPPMTTIFIYGLYVFLMQRNWIKKLFKSES